METAVKLYGLGTFLGLLSLMISASTDMRVLPLVLLVVMFFTGIIASYKIKRFSDLIIDATGLALSSAAAGIYIFKEMVL